MVWSRRSKSRSTSTACPMCMRPARRMRGRRPAPCTRASACGRWSSIGAPPTAVCRRCSEQQTLPIDKRILTLDLKAAAEAEWNAASQSERSALMHYADGVNDQMLRMVGRESPLEFQILRFATRAMDPDRFARRGAAARVAPGRKSSFRAREACAGRPALVASDAQRLAGAYPTTAPTVLTDWPPTAPRPSPTRTRR